MLRSVGLWHAILHRARADWPVVLAAWLLLACATTLVAAGALYGETVALGGVRSAVLAAAPADRVVLIRTTAGPKEVAAVDALVGPAVTAALSAAGSEVGLVARTGSLQPSGIATDQAGAHLVAVGSYRGIDRHTALVAGRWAEPGRQPVEATLSEGAAIAFGLTVGADLRLVAGLGSTPVDVVVVGIWRPVRDDGYWLGDPLELDGIVTSGQLTTRGPLVVAQEDLAAGVVPGGLDLQWRGLPAVDGLRVETLGDLRSGIATLRDRLRVALPPPHEVRVTSGLPDILARVERAALVSRASVLLLTAQFAVLAGYAVLLVAGMLIERRRAEVALLRARGGTTGHLLALALGEALLLAVPAAAIAPFLAVGIVHLLGAVGPLAGGGLTATAEVGGQVALVAAAAGLACALALALPTLASGASPIRIRASLGRGLGRTLAQRLGIDLVLVVLAALALWQLRLYGAPVTRDARGGLTLDPLLVVAPAIGLLAGAVVATRLLPRLAEVAERVLSRRRGLVPPLGARQLARRPLRYTRSALLLTLAAALGTFAAADIATLLRSQTDQAAYQAAADVRMISSDFPTLADWAVGPALRSVAGVEAVQAVQRGSLDVGRTVRDGQLLAVDAAAVGSVAHLPPDTGTPTVADGLRTLAEARAGSSEVDLPGRPERLVVTVDAALDAQAGDAFNPVPADYPGISVSVVLLDADGRLQRFDGGSATMRGTGQQVTVPLTGRDGGLAETPAYPLKLEAIELVVGGTGGNVAYGTIDIRAVSVGASGAGATLTPTAFDAGAAGWTWDRSDLQGGTVYQPPKATPGRIVFGVDPYPPLYSSYGGVGVSVQMRVAPGGDGTLPALVGERFLELTGAQVGQTLEVDSVGTRLALRIVGVVPAFPPLLPANPFVVVDGPTLDQLRFAATGGTMPAAEWWLAVAPGRSSAVAETLAGPPFGAARVVERAALNRSIAGDPVALGVIGALALGSIAAVIVAAIGFLVGATVSANERLAEFAVLRALGLSGRQLSAWLTLEQAILLVVGLLAGALIGLVLAWVVLPVSTLGPDGSAAVPAPVIVVPWAALAAVGAATVGAMTLAVLGLVRRLSGLAIGGALREGGE